MTRPGNWSALDEETEGRLDQKEADEAWSKEWSEVYAHGYVAGLETAAKLCDDWPPDNKQGLSQWEAVLLLGRAIRTLTPPT